VNHTTAAPWLRYAFMNIRRTATKTARKALDRADAQANRYLDTERGYYDDEKQRQFDAAEAAKDRASQERRAAMGATQGATRPTQGQLTADTFYNRATDALDAIDEVENSIGAWDLVAPNFMQTGAGQQYHQAKKQFVEAYLRKDSGAAIGKDEYNNADATYFPQVGDSGHRR